MTEFEVTGTDGKQYVLDITVSPKDPTLPTPPGISFPEGANTVTINGESYPLTGIDQSRRIIGLQEYQSHTILTIT